MMYTFLSPQTARIRFMLATAAAMVISWATISSPTTWNFIRQLDNLGDDAIAVCLAKGRIVEAVEDNWSLSRQCEAIGLNLRQDSGDGGGVKNPPALRDGVGDDPHVGRRVGQPVGVAAADEEGGRVFCRLGKDGGKGQVSR